MPPVLPTVDTYIPLTNHGEASFETQTFGANTLFFEGFDVTSKNYTIAGAHEDDVIPALTVMEQSPIRGIQPAIAGSGHKLIGVLAHNYDGTVSTLKRVSAMKSGKFNVAALKWDVSFDYASKFALFDTSDVLDLGEIVLPST